MLVESWTFFEYIENIAPKFGLDRKKSIFGFFGFFFLRHEFEFKNKNKSEIWKAHPKMTPRTLSKSYFGLKMWYF